MDTDWGEIYAGGSCVDDDDFADSGRELIDYEKEDYR